MNGDRPPEKCTQTNCNEPALYSFVWPGHGRVVGCLEHTERAAGVAEALGISRESLDIQELDEP